MNLEYFIASRVQRSTDYKNSVSAPIIKIATAAIAIGIVVMLIAIATGIGLQHKIKHKISVFNGHISISLFDRNNSITTVKPISINQDFYPDFNSVTAVEHIQAVATLGGMIRTETDFEGVIFKGVGTDYNWDYFKDFMVLGDVPGVGNEHVSREVLISDDIARRLQLNVGDKVPTYFVKPNATNSANPTIARAFVVSGIYDSGLEDYDSKFIIGDIRHVQRINKWSADQVGRFEVFITDFDDLDQVGAQVFQNTSSILNSQTIKQEFPEIFSWLALLDVNIYIIITVVLIVGIINMITALLVLILERTRMIGILKALGASNWTVRKIFIYNAMSLIIKGMIIGNLIGLLLIGVQYYYQPFKLDPNTYFVNTAPVYISYSHLIVLNVSVFVVCLIVLLLPTYLVSKISPVKAMKFS